MNSPKKLDLNQRATSRSAHLIPRTILFYSLFFTLVLLALPAIASAQDDGWQLRIGGVWVDPTANFLDLEIDGDRVEAGADGDFGFGLALERRFSSRLGLEIGALTAEPDLGLAATLAGFQFSASDRVEFTAVTAGLNVHLTPGRAVDLYIGPLFAYVLYGDVSLNVQTPAGTLSQNFSSDDDFALGAQIGADFWFGESPWSLNLAAKYLDTSLEITDSDGEVTDLGFEPLILSVGFGYRF